MEKSSERTTGICRCIYSIKVLEAKNSATENENKKREETRITDFFPETFQTYKDEVLWER